MARLVLTLALAVCLVACASAALPDKFNTTGGPPFLTGPASVANLTDYTDITSVGWFDGNSYRLVSTAGNGQFITVDGTYQSWQCSPDGSYNALVSVSTTAADGTKTTKTVCERGLVLGSMIEWSQSETECPIMGDQSLTMLTYLDMQSPCTAAPFDMPTTTDTPVDVLPGAPTPAPAA